MSFRGRLTLFFGLIVVIPIAAIALLVASVTGDSRAGKADAGLAAGLTTALALYEQNIEDARAQATELVTEPAVAAALRAGDAQAIRRATAEAGRSRGLERLAITTPEGTEIRALGGGEAIGAADVRAAGFTLTASVTGPTEYVEDVARITGLDAALSGEGGTVAATRELEDGELPAAGEAADVEARGETLRAAAGALPERGDLRVAVVSEFEPGGFFDSSPRVVAVLAVFLAVALGLVYLLLRTLQGQIAAMLDAARRIGGGDFSRRVPVVGRDEMAGLAGELNRMSDRLEAQISQLRRQRTELERSTIRLGQAFAAGLDRDALLEIVAETALGGCDAEYCRIALADGTVIERPEGPAGAAGRAREAALAGGRRAGQDGAQVVARRDSGHALGAPLQRLGETVGSIAVAREGEPFNDHERDAFLYLIGQASASIENILSHERVSQQAVTDELTGLANSRAFRATIEREAARAERFGHELSLIILDVDDFKRVNDTRGHLQGDEVLRAIGRILESEPRAIDEPARYGGEEFVVALPETDAAGAAELAERVRARLQSEEIRPVDGGDPLHVTASFGTATLPASATTVRELFAAADAALYEAKRSGKNRVVTAPDTVRSRR